MSRNHHGQRINRERRRRYLMQASDALIVEMASGLGGKLPPEAVGAIAQLEQTMFDWANEQGVDTLIRDNLSPRQLASMWLEAHNQPITET